MLFADIGLIRRKLSFDNSKWNKQLYLFTCGNELFEFLKALHYTQYPDLILLDYNMPLLSGVGYFKAEPQISGHTSITLFNRYEYHFTATPF